MIIYICPYGLDESEVVDASMKGSMEVKSLSKIITSPGVNEVTDVYQQGFLSM
jgi:hypothetical protein